MIENKKLKQNTLNEVDIVNNLIEPIRKECVWELQYKKNICTTMFPNATDQVMKKDIDEYLDKIENIENQLSKIWSDDQELNKIIEQTINNIKMFQSAIYIEAEKWGYKITDEEREKYVKEVDKYQELVYWKRISDNSYETNLVLEELAKVPWLDESKIWKKFNKPEIKDSNTEKWVESETNNLWTIKSKEHVIEIIKKVLDIYGLNWIHINRKEDIEKYEKDDKNIFIYDNEDSKNISVNGNILDIPWNKQEYDVVYICKVLIEHEIETHILKNKNNIYWIDYAEQLWYNEAIAKLKEIFVLTNDIDEFAEWVSHTHIRVFLWENFENEKVDSIMNEYFKSQWSNTSVNFDRLRRFYPSNSTKTNRKDIHYNRPFLIAVKYLKEQFKKYKQGEISKEEFENLIKISFSTKTSKNFIENMTKEEIKEALNTTEKELINPLFIWKLVTIKLTDGKLNNLWIYNELDLGGSKGNKVWTSKKVIELIEYIKAHRTT